MHSSHVRDVRYAAISYELVPHILTVLRPTHSRISNPRTTLPDSAMQVRTAIISACRQQSSPLDICRPLLSKSSHAIMSTTILNELLQMKLRPQLEQRSFKCPTALNQVSPILDLEPRLCDAIPLQNKQKNNPMPKLAIRITTWKTIPGASALWFICELLSRARIKVPPFQVGTRRTERSLRELRSFETSEMKRPPLLAEASFSTG
jgi:hypothetical protein